MKRFPVLVLLTGLLGLLALPAGAESKVLSELKRGATRGREKPAAVKKSATTAAASSSAQPNATPVPLPPDAAPDAVLFTIDFNGEKDAIVIKLLPEMAPKTVENFRQNITANFYDGQAFHRVIRNYLVQTGDPLSRDEARKELWGTTDNGQSIPGEFAGKHKRWAVAMAHKPGETTSSGSQFYICLRDAGDLDGQYSVFGEVIQGKELLNRISGVVVDTNDAPVKRIQIVDTKLIRSDSKIATAGTKSGLKKSKPDSQKGAVEKFIERVW
jgi:cyclophilin family peptidyl-prolyl cis-trans isomerase